VSGIVMVVHVVYGVCHTSHVVYGVCHIVRESGERIRKASSCWADCCCAQFNEIAAHLSGSPSKTSPHDAGVGCCLFFLSSFF
jgi:hypothetical protein